MVEHRDELLDWDHPILPARVNVEAHARRLHKVSAEESVGSLVLIRLWLRLEHVRLEVELTGIISRPMALDLNHLLQRRPPRAKRGEMKLFRRRRISARILVGFSVASLCVLTL